MSESQTGPLGPASPFFIVNDVPRALAFYQDQLGLEVRYAGPAEPPFFGLVGRGSAQICLKAVDPEVGPLPNVLRHPWAFWDAFLYCPDPEAMQRELRHRGTELHRELQVRDDGLHGFEVADADGYVLFFGCPV